MSEHTPGPWKVFDGWGSSKFAPVVVDCIPDVEGKFVGNCICHIASTNADAFANARLIAAAPLMYEALEEIVNNVVKNYEGSMDIYPEAIAVARAALQAAKGGGDVER
jgi:hypothetical protein